MKKINTSFCNVIQLSAVLWMSSIISYAQSADKQAGFKVFLELSNSYKQLPLYLNLEINNSTNYITNEQDTTKTHAEFFLQSTGAYIKLGSMEQILNDSLALLVNNDIEKMIIYPQVQPLSQLLLTGLLPVTDSTVDILSQKYRSEIKSLSDQLSVISINSRDILKGTSFPRQTMEIAYHPTNKVPASIVTTIRNLFPLDSADYELLRKEPGLEGKVFSMGRSGYYLLKEQTTSFLFKQLHHDTAITIPVTQSDRIRKNESGEFIPVKQFETYSITIN